MSSHDLLHVSEFHREFPEVHTVNQEVRDVLSSELNKVDQIMTILDENDETEFQSQFLENLLLDFTTFQVLINKKKLIQYNKEAIRDYLLFINGSVGSDYYKNLTSVLLCVFKKIECHKLSLPFNEDEQSSVNDDLNEFIRNNPEFFSQQSQEIPAAQPKPLESSLPSTMLEVYQKTDHPIEQENDMLSRFEQSFKIVASKLDQYYEDLNLLSNSFDNEFPLLRDLLQQEINDRKESISIFSTFFDKKIGKIMTSLKDVELIFKFSKKLEYDILNLETNIKSVFDILNLHANQSSVTDVKLNDLNLKIDDGLNHLKLANDEISTSIDNKFGSKFDSLKSELLANENILRDSLLQVIKKIKNFEENFQKNNDIIVELNKSNENYKNEFQEFSINNEFQITKLKESNKKLSDEIEELKKKSDTNLSKEIESLKTEKTKTDQLLNQIFSRVASLETQNNKLQAQYNKVNNELTALKARKTSPQQKHVPLIILDDDSRGISLPNLPSAENLKRIKLTNFHAEKNDAVRNGLTSN